MKKLLYVLTGLCLLAGLFTACEKPEKENEKSFEPIEPELQEDYTETAFGINLEMVYVKGGEFTMGVTPEQGWNLPDSTIKKLTRRTKLDSYHIGKYEVTQAQWMAVMGTNISEQRDKIDSRRPLRGVGNNYPMYFVGWEEAQEFCKKLSEQTGKKYILPTETQWEYAARGGVHKTNTQYAGSNDIEEVAWYAGNSYDLGEEHPDYGTHPVGTKKANVLGIYDMSGNVWEWCSDKYADEYDKEDDYNPQGPAYGIGRVWRGGSWGGIWSSDARTCRVSYRDNHISGNYGYSDLGFRVACIAE